MPHGEDVALAARGWIGTPYRHRASLKGVGCDCLGLVRGVWRELIGPEPAPLPPYAPDWAEAVGRDTLMAAAHAHLSPAWIAGGAAPRAPTRELVSGDIVLFRFRPDLPAKHAGILGGPSSFIHAYEASAVTESPLGPWWRRRIAGVFRFP